MTILGQLFGAIVIALAGVLFVGWWIGKGNE